ncbi:MAG: ATP-binding protein [Pseudomonadota bacterium]
MRDFFGSMTGRVFLTLVIGIAAAALLAQWLAENERVHAVAQFRDSQALERAEEVIQTADVVAAPSRQAYLGVIHSRVLRLELGEAGAALAPVRSEFANALATRLGPAFQVASLVARPPACEQAHENGMGMGMGMGAGVGATPRTICEGAAVHLRDGQLLHLSMLPPRNPPGGPRRQLLTTTTGILFLLIIAILAYLVARMSTRPLKQLAQAAKDLGNDINHAPLVLAGASEIRQASAAFNAMQARIRQYIFQRTQMLAAITHDLQTPLTRLRLRLEKVADAELQERLIGDLSAMQAMVREGLDLARSMDTTEAMQALDLDSLLDSVCADAADAGQQVRLDGRAAMKLMGRPMAMRRCLSNLIDNALKYGQHANVTVERLVGAARVRIRDDGPGIAPEELARVFEPFYRVDTSRSRESGGTGLGLTIARNIAEQHGGSILLANHPQGGLEVTLMLPEYYAA